LARPKASPRKASSSRRATSRWTRPCRALQKLIDDGTYMKILKYWGVQDGAISKPEINTPGTNE
jgi:hypothetical protein